LIEINRRALELISDKQQHADGQNEELHRNFAHGIEHQAQPAFAQGGTGEVTLHLRLVRAEICQHVKGCRDHA